MVANIQPISFRFTRECYMHILLIVQLYFSLHILLHFPYKILFNWADVLDEQFRKMNLTRYNL